MRTLEQYLHDCENAKPYPIIDFAFRATEMGPRRYQITVHPDGKDGHTVDYYVRGNSLYPVADTLTGGTEDAILTPTMSLHPADTCDTAAILVKPLHKITVGEVQWLRAEHARALKALRRIRGALRNLRLGDPRPDTGGE